MFSVHIFLDGVKYDIRTLAHLPRIGDTLRFAGEVYGIVSTVVWCLDEPWGGMIRVNMGVDRDPPARTPEATEPASDSA